MSELPALARPSAGSLIWLTRALSFTEDQLTSARVMVPLVSLSKMLCAFALLFTYSFPFTTLPVFGSISAFSPNEAPTGQKPPNSGIYSFGFARNVLR